MAFKLEPLPYSRESLAPYISARERRSREPGAQRRIYRSERRRNLKAIVDHLLNWDFAAANWASIARES
jgi:superoxide dismutase